MFKALIEAKVLSDESLEKKSLVKNCTSKVVDKSSLCFDLQPCLSLRMPANAGN